MASSGSQATAVDSCRAVSAMAPDPTDARDPAPRVLALLIHLWVKQWARHL